MTKNAVDETIEKFQVMLNDIINLSLTNEDVIIHRNQIGLSDEHLITLVQIITKKLRNLNIEFNCLIERIK